jgi:hypothetical protein
MPLDTDTTSAYAAQSPVTEPGAFANRLDAVPDDIASIKDVARQLVFHYRGDGDWAEHGIAAERIGEIDTRYADAMFRRLFELKDAPLTEPRQPGERLVGCCRDFTVLFLAIARHKGIPARSRVGFATYFAPGWNVDHVVAEVWDAGEGRWRLVDAELDAGHVDSTDDTELDPLDLPRDRFITGPQAWLACRAENADPERFVVAPDLDIPDTRGWPYLMHNLVHDLASLNRHEMLLWEDWGILLHDEPMLPDHLDLLDQTAALMMAPDSTPATLGELYARDEFRVPSTITSFSPARTDIPFTVDLPR